MAENAVSLISYTDIAVQFCYTSIMRIRRALALLALLLTLPALTGVVPQRTSTTSLTMTLYLAGDRLPMSDVPVTVYYYPFNPPPKYELQVMATAMTNAAGRFTATINTSMVPKNGTSRRRQRTGCIKFGSHRCRTV